MPLASDLVAALPGPVANQLKDWINEYVAGRLYGNAGVKSELDALAAAIQTVIARPDVVSKIIYVKTGPTAAPSVSMLL